MNILFITQLLPYPPDTGGKVKTLSILKILSQKHNIHLVSFVDKEEDLSSESYIKLYCKSAKTFVAPVITKKHKNLIFKIIVSFFLLKPFVVYKFYLGSCKYYVQDLILKQNIDIFYLDHINLAQYIPQSFYKTIIYDEPNLIYMIYFHYFHLEKNIIKKLFFLIEYLKLKEFEKKWIPTFSHVFSISKLDKRKLVILGGSFAKISFLPVPFKTRNLFQENVKKPVISFVAMLSWRPNEKGILWFIDNIWQLLQDKIPNIKLKIAGKNGETINNIIVKKGYQNIEYLGYVKDLNSLYKQTNVFIVPIFLSGGIRIKLLDAMSHGIPVVTTSFGAEGVEINNEREVLIADTPEDFVNAIVRLIKDKKLAKKLSGNAIKFIKRNYNVEKTKKALNIINHI